MATISAKSWDRYINALRKLNTKATNRMLEKIREVGTDDREALEELIRYAYGIATRYGEGSSALSAEMYDALAELSGKIVPPAVPAPTASYGDVAKAVYGTDLQSKNPQVMADSIGRLVKMAGVDTMQQNALRDGAEWAWIPHGDTCAFCIMLASNGWQRASKKAIKNGHAMHIHANCDCTYAIRFNSSVDVEGYNNGKEYRDMYYGAEGSTPEERVNYIRRRFYAENKGIVGAESSKAEEFIPIAPNKAIIDFEKKAKNLENERAIITFPDGRIYDQSRGRANRVFVHEPPEAGFFFSHNHPAPATFSVEDVKGFERAGYKQIRAVSKEKTFILEAVDPKQLKGEDRLFTEAYGKIFDELEDEAARRRRIVREETESIVDRAERSKVVGEGYDKITEWLRNAQGAWLKENAPKYGYRYIEEPTK